MATEAALVHDGALYLPSKSTPIQIGSAEWLEWLKSAKKFRFSHSQGHEVQPGSGIISFRDLTFTAFRAGKNSPYWNAQRRKSGDLRTRYLGRDEDLTYETMLEVALMLDKGSTKDESKQRSLKSTRSESHRNDDYATDGELSSQAADEIAKLKAEVAKLTQELQLSEEISNRNFQERNEMWERYQEAHLKNQQIQADLKASGQELSLKSQECSELLAKLESSQSTYETDYETLLDLQTENMRLRDENQKLKQKFEGLPEREQELVEEISRLQYFRLENDNLKTWNQKLRQALEANPSPEKLIEKYETGYETIKKALPKPPKDLTRNWVEFWRFKAWLESRES
jgi:hypothetical protein